MIVRHESGFRIGPAAVIPALEICGMSVTDRLTFLKTTDQFQALYHLINKSSQAIFYFGAKKRSAAP